MVRILAVIWLLVCLQGCTSDRSTTTGVDGSGPASALAGQWQWDETCNGWGGCSDPGTTGYSKTIAFLGETWFAEYTAGELSSVSTFRVTVENGWNDEEVTILAIEGRPRRYIIDRLTGDSLVLLDECIDCGRHSYHRVPE